MPRVTKDCETCGAEFTAWHVPSKVEPRYCSQPCWLKKHNNPERNAQVARSTAAQRGDILRGRGEGKSYTKRNGRHEHRIVMEQKLGRPLLPGEIVHHEDRNKKNNAPDNLEPTTRPDHARLHNTGRKRHAQSS